ncbi:MAG: epoxyqueuosine reductase QueH [Bacilli bacterium]|nr:epoxyqueuosine reductase QueH [Bacilli bacterium]MDD4065639.1 epoxyqueuosine reductase QueH [Bacilli bacterium]
MDRFTYYRMGLKSLEEIKKSGKKLTLLMHVCCAPCLAFPITYLIDYFDVTLFFNNSNIATLEEYQKRLETFETYIGYVNKRYNSNVKWIVTPYAVEEFQAKLLEFDDHKEGGKRCYYCCSTRMNEAYAYASKNNYDYFTTIMTSSRQKDSDMLNGIGKVLQEKYPNTKYLFSDFKKGQQIDKSVEICKDLNLYRQNCCGCRYSKTKYEKDR